MWRLISQLTLENLDYKETFTGEKKASVSEQPRGRRRESEMESRGAGERETGTRCEGLGV